MTEPTHLAATRESYDTVAADYAERVPTLFADDRLGRAMLAGFAEHVLDDDGPVADALDLPDGSLRGIVAWWSIVHTPPSELPGVFAEFHRTLAPGGHVIMGFHVGDERRRPEKSFGHPVSYDSYRLAPDHIAELLGEAGLVVIARLLSDERRLPQACMLARK